MAIIKRKIQQQKGKSLEMTIMKKDKSEKDKSEKQTILKRRTAKIINMRKSNRRRKKLKNDNCEKEPIGKRQF